MDQNEQHKILIKTYELYMARYNAIFPRVPQDLRLYSTVNIGITGGLVALLHENLFNCEIPGKFVYPSILLLGGLAIIFIAHIGLEGTKSSYDAWTRTITTLAKLERLLGLHEPQEKSLGKNPEPLWKTEPIVFPNFKPSDIIDSKDAEGSSESEKFVNQKWNKENYSKISRKVFCWWEVVGVILFGSGLGILICRVCKI